MFTVGRNYLDGEIPNGVDKWTSLRTIFLSSNRFRCNAPHLDAAVDLGLTRYEGIVYPANIDLSQKLLKTADVIPWTDRLESYVPKVKDVCLLYTGNTMLGTDANLATSKSDRPRSLVEDEVRQGHNEWRCAALF